MPRQEMLSYLFSPSSVAIIGASEAEGKVGNTFLKSFLEGDFDGKLYPVNPVLKEVMGLKCYPDILSIPGEVELVIIASPIHTILDVINGCIEKGVKIVIMVGVGFGESGVRGRALEAEVVKIARGGGLRILGPNTMGLFCPHSRVNTLMPVLQLPFDAGHISVVGQSGWVSENSFLLGYERGLRYSKVIDSGNEGDLTAIDFIEYFAEDPDTKIIGAYIEGVKDGQDFIKRLREAGAKKPVIICKGGKTEAGARVIASHTGSLAGNFAVFSTAIKQAGAIRADGLEELVDSLVAFTSPFLPKGNRVGLIVESGGGGTFAIDMCQAQGLEVPELPEDVSEKIKELFLRLVPSVSAIHNPVDLVFPPFDGRGIQMFTESLKFMSEFVDVFLLLTYHVSSFASEEVSNRFLDEIEKVREEIRKPIVLVPGYITDCPARLVQCAHKNIPSFPTPERAAKAISTLLQFSLARDNTAGTIGCMMNCNHRTSG